MIAFYNVNINEKAKMDNAPHYGFCCPECMGRECWSPGIRTTDNISVTGGTLYGQRLRIDIHELYVCTWMFDYGCPEVPRGSEELAIRRANDGWRSAAI